MSFSDISAPSGLAEEPASPRRAHELLEALHLRAGGPPAERGDAVVAPPLVVRRGIRAAGRLRDGPGLPHPREGAVERARVEPERPRRPLRRLLHDRVAVPLLVGEGEEHLELDPPQGGERRGRRLHCHAPIYVQRIYASSYHEPSRRSLTARREAARNHAVLKKRGRMGPLVALAFLASSTVPEAGERDQG